MSDLETTRARTRAEGKRIGIVAKLCTRLDTLDDDPEHAEEHTKVLLDYCRELREAHRRVTEIEDAEASRRDDDPTPYCHICHAHTPAKCRCGPVAENR